MTNKLEESGHNEAVRIVAQVADVQVGQIPRWCRECSKDVEMVVVTEACLIIGVAEPALLQQLESGKIHYLQTDSGQTYICLNSLIRSQQ